MEHQEVSLIRNIGEKVEHQGVSLIRNIGEKVEHQGVSLSLEGVTLSGSFMIRALQRRRRYPGPGRT